MIDVKNLLVIVYPFHLIVANDFSAGLSVGGCRRILLLPRVGPYVAGNAPLLSLNIKKWRILSPAFSDGR